MTGTRQDKEGIFSPSGRVSIRQLRSVSALVPCSTAQTTLRPLENPWGLLTVMLLPTTTCFLRPSFLQGLLLPVSYDQVSYDCFLQTIKWIVEKEGYNSPNSMIQAIRLFLLERIQEFFMPLLTVNRSIDTEE